MRVVSPFELRRAEIVRVIQENENTKRFLLRAEGFPDFKPGQFNMLYVFAQGEVPISISSMRKDLLEHTVRLVGEVTEDLFLLGEGDIIGLRGPYGTHFPVEESMGRDIVLVAGGLGLADIKPVVEFIAERRKNYGRVYLLVGARTPTGLLCREEYESWRERDIEVLLSVDRPDDSWKGHVGVVTELFKFVEVDPKNCVGMTCGPEVMMWFVTKRFLEMGLGEESVYLSMERHMKCAVGTCGHCQFGYTFVCKDGPIFPYQKIKPIFGVREL